MPVKPRKARSTRSLVLGVLGLVLGIVLVLALFVLAIPSLTEQNRIEVRLGDDVFVAGSAERLSPAIAADGPLLLADVASGDRDVYLQHVGSDPATGWIVFDARQAGTGRECTLTWQGDRFTDPCGGPDVDGEGTGLRRYDVKVDEDGNVVVDLVMRTSTTSTIAVTGGQTGN